MRKLLSFILTGIMIIGVSSNIIIAEDVNLLVDGEIEAAAVIPDGGWKPSVGVWQAGLGTSADIDVNVISSNSTKSAKITNAALYQAVGLTKGEKYKVSFDIFLEKSFDKSKAQWGMFEFNGDWIGTQVNGYKNGSVITETKFNPAITEAWQNIELEFVCTQTTNFVLQFFYGGSDSIYIDNASVVRMESGTESTQAPEATIAPNPGEGKYLVDNSFESGAVSKENEWKFTNTGLWYGCGNASINTGTVHDGEYSVLINGGAVGQKVRLEAGKNYKLSAYVYPTVFYAGGVNLGFYDGAAAWPMSNAVKVNEIPIDWTNDWVEYSVIMECTETKDYVVGSFVSTSDVYFDQFTLVETDEKEVAHNKGISVDYNTQSEVTYNKNKLLNLSRGGYLINNNLNYMPSLYGKMSQDGINMVRMDWILADVFYEIVSHDESGKLVYDFTYLDQTLLPLLEKGMQPYMCMSRLPAALGADDMFGEARKNSVSNLTEYGEVISAIVRHYADMGYTGWYWESHNEPEDGHMGNATKVCQQYGAFAKAVKRADPTARVGGIGYRNGDPSKDAGWKTAFFSYLRDNPDVPIDYVSIHVYSGTTHFASGEAYQELMKTYGLKDIPIIFSEWNYDWTVGSVGSFKDTNKNAAYAAKRLFSVIAQENVDYVFYFTPSDAINPTNLMYGDSGIYTIDGHRKSVSNIFSMYNDLESECLQTESQFKLNQNALTYGVVTKNSDTQRVSMLLFNYSDAAQSLGVEIDHLPYEGNVKITAKTVDENSGNYYKDYAAGFRGYSETPNETPDTYVEITTGFTQYEQTINMTPYSIMEIVLEPTDKEVSEKVLVEKNAPMVNIAADKSVTTNSDDTSVTQNAKGKDLLWGVEKLTDSFRLTFDMVDIGDTNMGYRSEAFEDPDHNVWVDVDLQSIQKINTVKLYPLNDKINDGQGIPADLSVQVSTDKKTWKTVYTESDFDNKGSHEPKTLLFPDTDARYVRVDATRLSKTIDGYRMQLAEIEVFNNDVRDISILDDIICVTDGNTITAGTELTMYQALYNDDGTLKEVKRKKGTSFELQDISEDMAIFIWTDDMKPVINTIRK